MTTSIIDKIGALVRKAESTTFEGERDAYLAKANELLVAHDLEMADLVLDSEVEHPDTKIGSETVDFGYNSSQIKAWKRILLGYVAEFASVKSLFGGSYTGFFVGRKRDVEIAIALFDSLVDQISFACETQCAIAVVDGIVGSVQAGKVHGRTWRGNFLNAAVSEIGYRVASLVRERREQTAETGSALLVLTQTEIQSWIDDTYGSLRSIQIGGSETSGGGGGRAGATAGREARLFSELGE